MANPEQKMKLFLIEWVDSHSGRGWQNLDTIEEVCELLHCRSVGWLVKETKNCMTIVSSISGEKTGILTSFSTPKKYSKMQRATRLE